jgi:hypothetical protein
MDYTVWCVVFSSGGSGYIADYFWLCFEMRCITLAGDRIALMKFE